MQKQWGLGVILLLDEGNNLLIVDDKLPLVFVIILSKKLRFIKCFRCVKCFAFGMAVIMIRCLSLSFGPHALNNKVSIGYNLNCISYIWKLGDVIAAKFKIFYSSSIYIIFFMNTAQLLNPKTLLLSNNFP